VTGSYLVTGGSGFIGSHLVDALLARGDRVMVVDNLSTGRSVNLTSALEHPNFEFVQGSVLDELIVDELVNSCDTVIHLAAAVGVKLVVEQPLRSFTTNIRGAEVVVGAAHRYRRRILIASTSEIYGKNPDVPLKETSDQVIGEPSVVRWAYSTSKAVDEILASAYHRQRGLPTVVVRLFNTVGPRQSPAYGMVIPRLVYQALAGKALTIFGDGSQTRCFCHVSDVVAAMITLLDYPEAIGEVYNVGSTEEISINDLARRILDLTKSDSALEYIPFAEAYGIGIEDMPRRLPDTSKLRALTGWAPTHNLDQILEETITEARLEQGSIALAP
jgi:UDP-glucose 4-epimerase